GYLSANIEPRREPSSCNADPRVGGLARIARRVVSGATSVPAPEGTCPTPPRAVPARIVVRLKLDCLTPPRAVPARIVVEAKARLPDSSSGRSGPHRRQA